MVNRAIEDFRRKMKGRKVAVLGIGISNTPLIRYLWSMGADITAFDAADGERLKPAVEGFKELDIKYSLGKGYLEALKGFEYIFKTPGMRPDLPELIRAREEGAVITSEMEVFFDLCPGEIFAVTGSDGKTTTTTLIYNMLKEQGYRVWLGGNIGIPLLSRVEEMEERDKVVLELSSFQLMTMKKSPNVAVITNISPNHLDVHKSYEEYIEAKKNIFLHQRPDERFTPPRLVLNYDNQITRGFAGEAKYRIVPFARTTEAGVGVAVKKGVVVYRDGSREVNYVKAEDIVIPGVHNLENYMAAIGAVEGYVEPRAVRKVATTFKGVEHRLEFVREVNGVKFYNDSIGSSPTRTISGLYSFKQKVILIAGGYDKNLSYDELGMAIVRRVKKLFLVGQTASKIEAAVRNALKESGAKADIGIKRCETFEEAVTGAYEAAEKGDLVVLSPASASFDMFRNFEERGNRFKELVNSFQAF